ncbi:MAG: GAF domain-containing protein, partial [Anaerolineales bacterium]|nr:GAF domain-containing protein [Anaerolineales bacterium]
MKNIVDKRKEQTLRLLRRIVPAFTFSNFLVIGVFLLVFPDYAYVTLFLLPVLPISWLTNYHLRNGRVELASVLFVGSLWLTVTVITWVLGMLSPSIYSYILISLLASLLLSRRVVVYATVASIISMSLIFIFQTVGWTLMPPMEELELVGAWLGGVINLMLVTGFVYAATSNNQKALVNEQMVIADLLHKEQNFLALLQETNQALLNEQREREEAEFALLTAEERYKILFNTALVMYVITEHQQGEPIIVDCNEIWAHMLGYELDEVIGRPIRMFYGSESVNALDQYILSRPRKIAYKDSQTVIEDKRYLLAKDGRLIPTLFRLLLVTDEEGYVIGSQALYIDMTMFEEAQEQAYLYANRVEVMYRASLELSRSLNVDEVFKKLLENLEILVPYDSAHVMLIDAYLTAIVENPQHYAEWTSPDRGEIQLYQPNSNPILRRIYEEKETVIIDDTHEDPEWEVITGSEHIRNWMGVPLVVKDEVIGLYGVNKNEPHFFTHEHAQLAESLASQAAVSISNATLYGQVQQYARDLEHRVEQRTADLTEANGRLQQEIVRRKETEKMLLIQTEQLAGLRYVGLQLAEQLDLNLLLSFVLEEAVKLLAGDAGHLVLVEEQNGQEVLNVAYAYGETQIKAGDVIHHRLGVMGEVWESRKPFYQNHYKEW